MAMEIERKFLAGTVPGLLGQREPRMIEQGYLAEGDDEVRLRRSGDDRILTVKGGRGRSREETEIDLDSRQFDELWPVTASRRVAKRRYLVPLEDGHTAEVDVYEGALTGLRVVEVEFGSEQEADAFRPPPWFGTEVTGNDSYANQTLAVDGLPDDSGAGTR